MQMIESVSYNLLVEALSRFTLKAAALVRAHTVADQLGQLLKDNFLGENKQKCILKTD